MSATRKARVPMAEQIRLINECRQSGIGSDSSTKRLSVRGGYHWPGSSQKSGIFSGGSLTGWCRGLILASTKPLKQSETSLEVGGKNRLFSDSVSGANASAVVYTMVEIAKAHDLNIYGYLKFLPDHRPTKEMTDDQLAELAPWSEKLQSIKNCMWIIVNYSNSQRVEVIFYIWSHYYLAVTLFHL